MSQDEVEFICTVLTDAVAVLEDAESSPLNRSEAQRFCEELKDKPELCVSCGIKLASGTSPVPVRLFGFQILEHYVTHHWTLASIKEWSNFKSRVSSLMHNVAKHVSDENPVIRESLIRVKVKIIKREDPKNWPSTLKNLKKFMKKGHVHAELVMLVLLRLTEDVASIDQRLAPLCKVILDNNMGTILQMVMDCFKNYLEKYEHVQMLENRASECEECAQMVKATLKIMAQYFALVHVFHISKNNYALLGQLWFLLNNRAFQVEASECLLAAINILAIQPNNTPMLVLFDSVASRYIFQVSRTHEVLASKDYCFLKNVCNIMCVFGDQFCRIISLKTWHGKVPLSFERYLDFLFCFTTHNSHYMSSLTQSTWKALFTVERLSKDTRLLAVIPKYLSASRTKLLKVGFPSKNNSPSCEYSRIDFVTDVEFCKFLRNFREDQKQVIDVLCTLDQITCFQQASTWLNDLLQPPVDFGSKSSPIGGHLHSDSTNSFLEWEALTFFLKVVFTSMFQNLRKEAIPVKYGMQLLQLLLNVKTKDPGFLACFPLNIYTFLPLLRLKNEYLIPVVSELLEIIEEASVKSHTCNQVRRDACMCIVQLCKSYAKFILPSFNLLFNHVKQLLCDEMLQLTQVVKSKLMEAIVVLIKNFKDFVREKKYLEALMVPVSSLWLSEDMQNILADPESFVSYVGSDLKITDTAVESHTDLNRAGIINCVATILGVLQWTESPPDLEKKIGVVAIKHNCLNPCAGQVIELLDNLFILIRTQHNIYFTGVLSKLGELFPKNLNQPEIMNNSYLKIPQDLLDVHDPPEYSTDLERMQGFFSALYTSCFSVLGCACSSLNKDFYNISNLADKIANSAFVNLEYIPNYRLLCIVRVFLRPFLFNCPPEYYEGLASPVMGLFLTSVRLRLCCGWNDIEETNMISKEKSSFKKSELDKMILTKEVLQLIIDCCVDKDKIAITDGPNVINVINAQPESHEDFYNQGVDVSSFSSTVCSQDPGICVSFAGGHVTEASAFSLYCEDAEISVSTAGSEDAETLVSAVSRQGTDDNIVTAESDLCCVSREDLVTFVCTTESDDDDDDLSIAVADSSILGEKVDKGKESDFTCYVPNENTDSSVEVNLCSAANQGTESVVVDEKSDNVCVLFENIEASVMSSNNIDSEMAAEVPQEQAPLTKLGICLMKDEDVRSILLNTSFSALLWKDFCHKAATCLCWPLLQHVMSEPCILDTVIHLFTKVIKALQVHRHDLLVSNIFDCLAYRIYASFRPRYIELNRVMRQIPNINLFSLDTFDEMLLDAAIQKPDTGLQQFFKDLITSDVHEPFCEKKHSVDNVAKCSSKSMKHQMSTELSQTARKLIKRDCVEADGSEI